jgi:ZIP family zinc transporter
MDPTLYVLTYASFAAAASALGPLPLVGQKSVPRTMIGWANALAAGAMLGAAYVLSEIALTGDALPAAIGAVVGIGFIYGTHRASDTMDLDLNRLSDTRPEYGYQVVLVNTLHSATEGVAIGIAMASNLGFGAFVAVAIAFHNVPEATILSAVLHSRGVRLRSAAGIAVVTNVSQILLAVVVHSVVTAAPGLAPGALGFAIGALTYLVMVELLPESYKEAGPTSIALVTSITMGVLVLANGVAG